MPKLQPIAWAGDTLRIIDQTQLPEQIVYEDIHEKTAIFEAIKVLKVRGAPLIGITAAFGLYLAVRDFPDHGSADAFLARVKDGAAYLAKARPTAVNLFWALDRCTALAASAVQTRSVAEAKALLLDEAKKILEEDRVSCRQIGEHGFNLLKGCTTLLTHCNAGGLATGEYGTALAPIYVAQEKGKLFKVFADETRPLLQGARITALELQEAGILVTLICDSMAAIVMARGEIDAVIVGADRIAANGDVANKVGTYGLAVVAQAHKVPFFVAAPLSTFDVSISDGSGIPIEERSAEEITCGFGKRTAPLGVRVFNPAFDVTPNALIAGIITEKGVLTAPYDLAIRKAMTEKL